MKRGTAREITRDPIRFVHVSPHGAILTDKALCENGEEAIADWMLEDLDRKALGRRLVEEWAAALTDGGDR